MKKKLTGFMKLSFHKTLSSSYIASHRLFDEDEMKNVEFVWGEFMNVSCER